MLQAGPLAVQLAREHKYQLQKKKKKKFELLKVISIANGPDFKWHRYSAYDGNLAI